MTVSVCPAAVAAASVEKVWSLLADPARYSEWWDATTTRIEPPGPAQAGQIIYVETRAMLRRWTATLTIEEVDPVKHRIKFLTKLPFGIVGHNMIDCQPSAPAAGKTEQSACLIRYG